jgi:hypothetical protein
VPNARDANAGQEQERPYLEPPPAPSSGLSLHSRLGTLPVAMGSHPEVIPVLLCTILSKT